MRIAAYVLVALLSVGCAPTESEKAARAYIEAAARKDWSQGIINARELAQAKRLCAEAQPSRRNCVEVERRAQAIADAFASCADNDSTLCQAVLNSSALHQFGTGMPAPLPQHPFYLKLGNELLDALAPTFEYRTEMWYTWLDRWHVAILAILGSTLVGLLLFLTKDLVDFGKDHITKSRERAAREAEAKAAAEKAAREAEAKAAAEKAAREAEARAAAEKAAHEAEVEETRRLTHAAIAAAFKKNLP